MKKPVNKNTAALGITANVQEKNKAFAGLSILFKNHEIWFLLLALLLSFATGVARGQLKGLEGTIKVVRYGKDIRLEKNCDLRITDLNVHYEKGAAYLSWNTSPAGNGGIYVIMQSEDGIDYTYRFFIPSANDAVSHLYKLPSGCERCFYQVMHISNDNSYVLSDRKYPASYYASNAP